MLVLEAVPHNKHNLHLNYTCNNAEWYMDALNARFVVTKAFKHSEDIVVHFEETYFDCEPWLVTFTKKHGKFIFRV